MLNTPILFLVFNRPESTRITFDRIRQTAPTKLYVAADGPRAHVAAEAERCREVRQLIANGINWPCEVSYLYRENNLGCGKAVQEAINWFFSCEESGIILEDDCLPSDSFFPFCSEMLEKYKNNMDVFHITGSNFQYGKSRGNASYYFSSCIHVWGWASWRRAWQHYDKNMREFEILKRTHPLKHILPWSQFDEVYDGHIDTWDMQWFYTCLHNRALSIIPNQNLIRNIGFGSQGATHTDFREPDYISKSVLSELGFPLKHPRKLKPDWDADKFTAIKVFATIKYPTWRVLMSKFKKAIIGI
jgi:hypothetical protein